MFEPYVVTSDQHAHDWSAFSSKTAKGVNNRLQIICDELCRAADEVKAAGGNLMVMAGDLFHSRGRIDPEVFNPVHETIQAILAGGVEIIAIPGNHDLKSKETSALSSAVETLSALPGFTVLNEPTGIHHQGRKLVFVPWQSKPEAVLRELREHAAILGDPENYDAFIHAGIDGALDASLGEGLDPEELASIGYRRVFAGHYHNHRVMAGGKVISIGATTQQSFRDVGTKAGFIIVYPDHIVWRASHAPSFVDIDNKTDIEDYPAIADGNYVRVRGFRMTDKEVNLMRSQLLDLGARGVNIQVAREVTTARSTAPARSMSLAESVSRYIDKLTLDDPAAVKAACETILSEIMDKEA